MKIIYIYILIILTGNCLLAAPAPIYKPISDKKYEKIFSNKTYRIYFYVEDKKLSDYFRAIFLEKDNTCGGNIEDKEIWFIKNGILYIHNFSEHHTIDVVTGDGEQLDENNNVRKIKFIIDNSGFFFKGRGKP